MDAASVCSVAVAVRHRAHIPRRDSMRRFGMGIALASVVLFAANAGFAADSGLITKSSNHSAAETVQRFEKAVTEKGWIVFTEVDHAAAAAKIGQTMRP